MRQITPGILADCLQVGVGELPSPLLHAMAEMDMLIRDPSRQECERYFFSYLKRLQSPKARRNREENQRIWEQGWAENLQAMLNGVELEQALKPAYYRDSPYLRFRQDLIVTDNLQLEYDLLTLVRIWLFETFLRDIPRVVELGCGTGQNLYLLGQLFPDKELLGLDWTRSSQEILSLLRERSGLRIAGRYYDLFQPDTWPEVGSQGAILTIHAFEQLGHHFESALDLLLYSRAGLIVQLEPVVEFYDPENFYDYLALVYSSRRGYLSGYWERLCCLESQGKVEIIRAFRPQIGGVYHESSCLIWRPVC